MALPQVLNIINLSLQSPTPKRRASANAIPRIIAGVVFMVIMAKSELIRN